MGAPRALLVGDSLVVEREGDILECGLEGDEVEGLEDEAYEAVA